MLISKLLRRSFSRRKPKRPKHPNSAKSVNSENLMYKKELIGTLNSNNYKFESGPMDTLKREDLYFYGKAVSFIGTTTHCLNS